MDQELKKSYKKVNNEYFANSNSLHKLGTNVKKLENAATNQILNVLNLENYEIIYTSGNAESYELLSQNYKDLKTNDQNLNKLLENKNKTKNIKTHINLTKPEKEDLNKYDFITIEDEIPFFGVLIKRKNIELTPLIHGGKSTTKFRGGTAPTPLIVIMSKLIKTKYKK